MGNVSVANGSYECAFWNSTTPHFHPFVSPSSIYPNLVENYCRNPGNRGKKPWCYTKNPNVRWAYCDVLECGKFAAALAETNARPLISESFSSAHDPTKHCRRPRNEARGDEQRNDSRDCRRTRRNHRRLFDRFLRGEKTTQEETTPPHQRRPGSSPVARTFEQFGDGKQSALHGKDRLSGDIRRESRSLVRSRRGKFRQGIQRRNLRSRRRRDDDDRRRQDAQSRLERRDATRLLSRGASNEQFQSSEHRSSSRRQHGQHGTRLSSLRVHGARRSQ